MRNAVLSPLKPELKLENGVAELGICVGGHLVGEKPGDVDV